MSIPSRIWRLIRSEVNSRLGNFGPSPQPSYEYDEPYDWQETDGSAYEDSSFEPEGSGLSEYYRVLELPDGASLEEVRAAYKALIKKYHPDKFQDPQKRAEATELVKRINGAYAELEKVLDVN